MVYTNSTGALLFPCRCKGFGTVANIDNQTGISAIRMHVLPGRAAGLNIISQNQADTDTIPLFGQWVDPRWRRGTHARPAAGHTRLGRVWCSAPTSTRPQFVAPTSGRLAGAAEPPRVLAFTGLTPNRRLAHAPRSARVRASTPRASSSGIRRRHPLMACVGARRRPEDARVVIEQRRVLQVVRVELVGRGADDALRLRQRVGRGEVDAVASSGA